MSVRMLASPDQPNSKAPSRGMPGAALKLPIVLSARVQRIAVVAPTVFLSLWLSSLGFPLLPRVAVCIAFGVTLILLVARHQRRARLS
jgi:hypothetical protein